MKLLYLRRMERFVHSCNSVPKTASTEGNDVRNLFAFAGRIMLTNVGGSIWFLCYN